MQDQFHKTDYKIRGLMQSEVATGFNRYQDVFTVLNKEFTTFKNDIIYEKIAKVHFQSYLGPDSNLLGPILWQYGLWSFQMGYIKSERFLSKNQRTKRKFLNFENWTNWGSLSSFQKKFL